MYNLKRLLSLYGVYDKYGLTILKLKNLRKLSYRKGRASEFV